LLWLDRSGKSLGIAADANDLVQARLSPDGRHAALTVQTLIGTDLWVRDWGRGVSTRFTLTPGVHQYPVWSPDGLALLYSGGTPWNLYRNQTSGAETEARLTQSANQQIATDWSRDGRLLLYYETAPDTNRDLWILPLTEGNLKPRPYLRTPFN